MVGWSCPGCGACYSPLQMSCVCCIPGGPRVYTSSRTSGNSTSVTLDPCCVPAPLLPWLGSSTSTLASLQEEIEKRTVAIQSVPAETCAVNPFDAVNKTAREKGAVGPNAIVSKWVSKNVAKDARILDFGSGPSAPHTRTLRAMGFTDVTAYEVGGNFNPDIHADWPLSDTYNGYYDVVMLSNVLNVQSAPDHISQILRDVSRALRHGGMLVFNYPKSPRKVDWPEKVMCSIVDQFVGDVHPVVDVDHLYLCMKSKT